MGVIYQTKDQVSVAPIIAAPNIITTGAQTAGTAYTATEQMMLQAAYDAHRLVKTIR